MQPLSEGLKSGSCSAGARAADANGARRGPARRRRTQHGRSRYQRLAGDRRVSRLSEGIAERLALSVSRAGFFGRSRGNLPRVVVYKVRNTSGC